MCLCSLNDLLLSLCSINCYSLSLCSINDPSWSPCSINHHSLSQRPANDRPVRPPARCRSSHGAHYRSLIYYRSDPVTSTAAGAARHTESTGSAATAAPRRPAVPTAPPSGRGCVSPPPCRCRSAPAGTGGASGGALRGGEAPELGSGVGCWGRNRDGGMAEGSCGRRERGAGG